MWTLVPVHLPRGPITRERKLAALRYTYDPAGNRTDTVISGTTTNFAYNSAGQLCKVQYSSNYIQEAAYRTICAVVTGMGDCGTPKNRFEVIAYLWSVWMYNHHRCGGPSLYAPQYFWQTPTVDQIAAAIPLAF